MIDHDYHAHDNEADKARWRILTTPLRPTQVMVISCPNSEASSEWLQEIPGEEPDYLDSYGSDG